jgi:hypothetical protein
LIEPKEVQGRLSSDESDENDGANGKRKEWTLSNVPRHTTFSSYALARIRVLGRCAEPLRSHEAADVR